MQAMALSKAPVIASHSAARALWDHSRNLDDEQLLALKKNGGVVQTVAFASYVKVTPPSPDRLAALAALRKEFGLPEGANLGGGRGGRGAAQASPCPPRTPPAGAAAGRGRQGGGRGQNALASLTPEQRTTLTTRLAELDKKFPPPPRANVQDFVDHVDYIVKKIGIDHVGISSDFDGGGGVDGWNDASETVNVTIELVRRGYTEEQIAKIWSGNLLRVLDEVQKVAAQK
jgi:membrane dipeptidase